MLGPTESRNVWALLSGGGAVLYRKETEGGDYRLSMAKYRPLSDPQGAVSIAELLARASEELSPTVVVAWEDVDDVLLAFAVGAQLRIPVVRAFDVEGLVRLSGEIPSQPRAVLVTDAIREDKAIEALKTVFAQMGGTLAGVTSIVHLDALATNLPSTSLVSASDAPTAQQDNG
jgi:enamine deaminase RidA (YjgF/YER057c/UK114 family)